MAEHTPTPWQVFPKTSITARAGIDQVDGISIVCIGCDDDDAGVHGATAEEAAANAAHIVKCVNSHDALVKALEFYADPFAWKKKNDPHGDVSVPDFYSETDFGDIARAALASAQSVEGE